jgi:hypothetical protein
MPARPPFESPSPPWRRGGSPRAGGILLGLLLVTAGCSTGGDGLPEGTWLTADGQALAAFLAQVETLSGTPAARAAGAARQRIEACRRVEAHCPAGDEGCDLLERLACADASERPLAGAETAGWLVSHALAGGGHLVLRGWETPGGGVTVEASLPRLGEAGPTSLLLPAGEAPQAPVLRSEETLLHLRVRPDRGLDFDALVPPGSKRERFRSLQADLAAAASLEGSWEMAVYTPEPGRLFPDAALALDVSNRTLAVAAMESFLEEIMHIWPLRQSPFALGGAAGSCLSNLNVMPELAPCWVATDTALVVGWNAASLGRALGTPPAAAEDTTEPRAPERSRLVVHLDRLPEADLRLARAWNPGWDRPPVVYPWRRLELTGRCDGDHYTFRLELLPAGPS